MQLNSNNDFTDENPPLVPRPDSSLHGQSDSPTPALPPKNNAAPPKRPPPPRRPPPPGSGGKTGPPVPPPPQVGGNDPFSGSASNSGGGFADFAKFDSVDEQVKHPLVFYKGQCPFKQYHSPSVVQPNSSLYQLVFSGYSIV